MAALHSDGPVNYFDKFRAKNGDAVNLRFVREDDRSALQGYIRSMSDQCRYNRFLSPSIELPRSALDRLIQIGLNDRFTVIAVIVVNGRETIVGEACYAFHADLSRAECSLSIGDRWQKLGIGRGLLKSLECRAASFGAERIFGDTLRSNKFMIRLARKCGCVCFASPADWKLVRCEKKVHAR